RRRHTRFSRDWSSDVCSSDLRQPTLDDIAAQVHLSPFHFQRLFSRWTGVTPKRFLQVLTLERAKDLLAQSQPLLEVSAAVGLSSTSRLHDHFVQLEAVTPGEFKRAGVGVAIVYGLHTTPFGDALIAATARGICQLSFVDDGGVAALAELARRWPFALIREDKQSTAAAIDAIFANATAPERPLS